MPCVEAHRTADCRKLHLWWGCFALLLTILLVTGCRENRPQPQSGEAYTPDIKCKAWFFSPPREAVVGFSTTAGEPSHDAAVRLAGYGRTRVKGFVREYYTETEAHRQDSIFFYYDTSTVASVRRNMVVLDSMRMGTKYALLVALHSCPLDSTEVYIHEQPPPGWATLLESRSDKLHAQGTAAFSYYNMHNSWVQAEERAIKGLCERSVHYFASLEKLKQTDTRSELTDTYKMEFDLAVKNIQTVGRYYSPSDKTCNVLVSCGKSDISAYE